ncbi:MULTISPECIES: YezD family protein [Bacillales]|uniref:YezD family protein n=1 Tax=Lysinibacillus louembei TaxID=1470088 RepID=A0ABZ0S259_9BACI|nr:MULTISPECIES: YezD family protein [Bacillales]MCT6923742.1 YezD family protein [Metasolibacillus sp.]MCT6940025.1 YezD family protein [Metasolibacillus sp.]WPK13369.1 YezD family protein [Lysinibacillus louembei]
MTKQKSNSELTLESIKEMLGSIKFGTITLVIQDGHVVQIEKNEKIRLK